MYVYTTGAHCRISAVDMSRKMSSSKTSKNFLKIPFRNKRLGSPSPSATPRPAPNHISFDPPDAKVNCSDVSGTSIGVSPSQVIASSSSPDWLAQTAGDKSLHPQAPTVSVSPKNEAFSRALKNRIGRLSDDDKAAFQSATDVIEKLWEFQQDRSRISVSHATRVQKVQNLLQCVKQFLASIAICIQHSPQISAIVVGGFHCILTVSTLSIKFLFRDHL